MAREIELELVPSGWKYDLLDKFAQRCSGHTPSKSFPEYWNGGVKWVSLSDTFRLDKGLVKKTEKEISLLGIEKSSAVIHPKGTVVLSRDAGIGKSGIMAESMAVSQHFIAWKCDVNEELHNWFLYNWLQYNKPEFERQAVGSTIKTIGLPYFKKLKIAVPPYPEQRKIAEILSTWNKAIVTTEKLIAASQQQKKALMQQLLTGKKRFAGFSEAWEEVKLGDIATYSKGYTYKSDEYSESQTEYGFLTLKSILRGGGYSERGIKYLRSPVENKFSVEQGDIVFAVTDLTRNAEVVGAPILIPDLPYGKSFISMDLVKLKVAQSVNKEFFFYLMQSSDNRNFMRARASGSTVLHLDIKGSKQLKLKIPKNLTEQQKIAAVLTSSDQEINALQSKLAHLKQEKKALMQQLLTGKRRVVLEAETSL